MQQIYNLELVAVSKASVKYTAIGFILLHGLAVLAHVTGYYLQFTLRNQRNPVRVCQSKIEEYMTLLYF